MSQIHFFRKTILIIYLELLNEFYNKCDLHLSIYSGFLKISSLIKFDHDSNLYVFSLPISNYLTFGGLNGYSLGDFLRQSRRCGWR